MNNWEEEVSITLTRSEWLEVLLGLWDKREVIEKADTTEEVKERWIEEVNAIQKKIRPLIMD